MAAPNVLVLGGLGINCEDETKHAFEKVGAAANYVHVNDLIADPDKLGDYQIMAFPGGFSFGDDTGSGKALASRMNHHLGDRLRRFVEGDKLVIGICNGFQVLTQMGLVPGMGEGRPEVALLHNNHPRYLARWVDVHFKGKSPWTRDVGTIALPIAHGEGKLYAPDGVMEKIRAKDLIAGIYTEGDICRWHGSPANPNGSLDDIAALCDPTGRVLGMMPHPERAVAFTHRPDWTYQREVLRRSGMEMPEEGDGMKIFRNGVGYFS